ncbi:hypothetical protein [Hymenobacter jeollabukensis]|uniref:Uncharacterized protein n=1 Tax=Hymenobacter jeollabukensis TaxID=2025313 RepID=A0A5R8WJN1_9BACT|nr:hypothetical protein [Hymenobacter jeollabukensis]TLM89150.1 hypothetical protein FDY95_21510 [Hymenobacter jeollabukensis]
MDLSQPARLLSGIALILVPTIAFGGHFLLQLLSGRHAQLGLNPLQKSLMRAGHAHAGVLVLLCLLAQLFLDSLAFGAGLGWAVRLGFVLAPMLVSGGFFAAAAGRNIVRPGRAGLALIYAGALLLTLSTVTLGVALVRSA